MIILGTTKVCEKRMIISSKRDLLARMMKLMAWKTALFGMFRAIKIINSGHSLVVLSKHYNVRTIYGMKIRPKYL